jgi:hypothetical protein
MDARRRFGVFPGEPGSVVAMTNADIIALTGASILDGTAAPTDIIRSYNKTHRADFSAPERYGFAVSDWAETLGMDDRYLTDVFAAAFNHAKAAQ